MRRIVAVLVACGVLGTLGFAQTLTGEWDMTLSIWPSPRSIPPGAWTLWACGDNETGITVASDLTLNYVICAWTFSSVSGFDMMGFSSQKFTAEGVLGALTFSSTMNFIPAAVTAYLNRWEGFDVDWEYREIYGDEAPYWAYYDECCRWRHIPKEWAPKFDDWTVEASLDFAGVSVGALFFLERGNYDKTYYGYFYGTAPWEIASDLGAHWVQTKSMTTCTTYQNGAGWKFTLSGSVNGCTITSYTYFNLYEYDYDLYMAILGATLTDYSLAKSGEYEISVACGTGAECCPGFTEEYLLLEGLSFCCGMTVDAALKMTCSGFDSFKVLFNDIPFLCCGITFDFLVDFSLTSKSVSLKPKVAVGEDCLLFDVGVDFEDATITGLSIYGLTYKCELADCLKFTVDTSFDTTMHKIKSPIVGRWDPSPVPAIVCSNITEDNPPPVDGQTGEGWYEIYCWKAEYWEVFESLKVEACLPGCCGGEATIEATTYFGKPYRLDFCGAAYWDGTDWSYGWADYDGTDKLSKLIGTPEEVERGEALITEADLPSVTASKTKLVKKAHYDPISGNTLFGWCETDVSVSVPISTNISITADLGFSVYGWENLDLGFTFSF